MHSGYAKAAKVLAAITLVSLIAHSKLLLALVSLLTNDGNIMTVFLFWGSSEVVIYPLGLLCLLPPPRHRHPAVRRVLPALPAGAVTTGAADLGGHRDQYASLNRRGGDASRVVEKTTLKTVISRRHVARPSTSKAKRDSLGT